MLPAGQRKLIESAVSHANTIKNDLKAVRPFDAERIEDLIISPLKAILHANVLEIWNANKQ